MKQIIYSEEGGGIYIIILWWIVTNFGIESAARIAYEYDYNQILARDAMAPALKRKMNFQ